MPSMAARFPEEFERRVDEILLIRETYGLMIPPVRAAVMSDEDIQSIQAPTLYILGDSDGATADPRAAIERIESLMPHVQTLLVPGAAHDVVVAATDLVTERVMDFLLT